VHVQPEQLLLLQAANLVSCNIQVDRSNAERAADSEKLMAGIRSRAAGYGSTANKTTGRLQ
jgi:hypothetical protein